MKNVGGRPSKRPLLKDLKYALEVTETLTDAANYMRMNYLTFRKYLQEMLPDEWENYKSRRSMHPLKHSFRKDYEFYSIHDVVEKGVFNGTKIELKKFIDELIRELVIPPQCDMCGFSEARIYDAKYPLLLNFRDGDRTNYYKHNLQFLCFNCYFLFIGHPFDPNKTLGEILYDEETGEMYYMDKEIE